MKKIFPLLFLLLPSFAFAQFLSPVSDFSGGTAQQLKAYRPNVPLLTVLVNGYNVTGDCPPTTWIWNGASTASTSNWILQPTAGGAGRWTIGVINGEVTLKQLGIFPASDNTADIQAAVTFTAANKYKLVVDPFSTYKIDATSVFTGSVYFGILMKDNMFIRGGDKTTSIIQAKANTASTTGKNMFYADTVHNPKFDNLTIDGFQAYSSNAVTGSGVLDTLGYTWRAYQLDSGAYTNMIIKNAMNGIFFITGHDNKFNNNSWDSIGNAAISTSYSHNIQRNEVAGNIVHRFDLWNSWSTALGKRQEGNDFLSSGGTRWNVHDNYLFNDAKQRWAWSEMRIYGPNWFVNNYVNGYGKNSMGITLSGDLNTGEAIDGLVYERNTMDSVLYDDMNAQDTTGGVVKYWFNGLQEFYNIKNSSVRYNHFKGNGITLNGKSNNNYFEGNDWIAPDSRSTPGRAGENIMLTIGAASGDTIRNTYLRYNTGNFATAEIARTVSNGSLVDGLHIDYNTVYGSSALTPSELYGGSGGVAPLNVTFANNLLRGTLGGGKVFYSSNTGAALQINAFGNNFIQSDIDSSSNMYVNLGGTASLINLEGSQFSWGVYSYRFDSLRNNAGAIEGRRNGIWKPQTDAVTFGIITGTDANLTISGAHDYLIKLVAITANRTLTLPTASSFTGRTMQLINTNASAFFWLGSGLKDLFGNSIVNIPNKAAYALYSNGTDWIVTSQLPLLRQALTDASTVSWDVSLGSNAYVTLGGNRTLSITNAQTASYGTIVITQDGTGSRTLTLPAGSKVASGGSGAITLSTAAGSVDILTYYYDSVNYLWTVNKNYN